MRARITLLSIVLIIPFVCPLFAAAETFDSMDYLPDYDSGNAAPWSWGVPRYQLYFSKDLLNGYQGNIDKITFFAWPGSQFPDITYELSIFISSTNRTTAGLSGTNLEENHGEDKTLVFSGPLDLTWPEFVIDVDNVYNYTNTANLLIDFYFHTTSPQDGLFNEDVFFFQAFSFNDQPDIARTYTDLINGPDVILNSSAGALRTQIDFTEVPEPASLLLFAFGGLALRRKC